MFTCMRWTQETDPVYHSASGILDSDTGFHVLLIDCLMHSFMALSGSIIS